ncbi:serine/threonine-protein kinase [Saccharopolyspora gloriosae]|uniref:non-specific serine/threonine protein kinase n=1 Tax=Saccharopolyspora gloriosae TaxID=455344 RepID=A0A840NFS8_9PSEU|nr:protein kinase [Saccharopolyspora gloriosae]MBB5070760.1 serine/threonine protein kinase [Saccharopolyspora gloriosae]
MSAQDRLVAGRYRVESRLGSGAMGVVWKASDERLNRTVAVKELHLRQSLNDADVQTAKRRAIREGRITARLMHRHAIAVYDVVEEDGRPCLIMEFLESRSMEAVLADRGTMPVAEVAKLGADVASALAAAHDAGIVHRDVKPGNILVAEDITKITDFGISRALGDASTTGVLAGTPAYLAPEVAQGGKADFHTDVFSLGSTLYAALEGRPPFGLGDNSIALLHRVAAGDFDVPEHAEALTPVLLRMLATEPAQRPTMHEAQRALAAVSDGKELPESFTAVPVPTPTKPARPEVPPQPEPESSGNRGRYGLIVVGALLVVGAGVIAALLTGNLTGDPTASRPAASQPPQPRPEPSPVSPPEQQPAPVEPPAPQAPPQAQTPDAVVSEYYAAMPGNLPAAWEQLTPDYQTNHAGGYEAFSEFWAPVQSVQASNVSTEGANSALATITYDFDDGRTVEEKTRYTLVRDGESWKIAATTVLSSRTR